MNDFSKKYLYLEVITGDAGGPIIFNNRVVGIISWVEPCFGGTVNVNTRIATYVDWIISTIFS